MRVIGVVDLLGGQAVHACGGTRESYEPVRRVGGWPTEPGDALALARGYMNLGVNELYAADLDAILTTAGFITLRVAEAGRRQHPSAGATLGTPLRPRKAAASQRKRGLSTRGLASDRTRAGYETARGTSHDSLVVALTALGPPLWLDAGVSSGDQARHALRLGATRVVVGLETLPSYDALEAICVVVGGERVAFSLDVRDGKPVILGGTSDGIPPDEPAHVLAARAADAGVGAIIVIDLARVGTGMGLDLELIARVRDTVPSLTLLAGGGVRGFEDLAQLADAGCDGALVATALHDGRLGATEVAATRQLGHSGPAR